MGLNTLEPNWSQPCKVLREQKDDFDRFNSHYRFCIQFSSFGPENPALLRWWNQHLRAILTPLGTQKEAFAFIFRCFTSSSDFCKPSYCLSLCPSTPALSTLIFLCSPLPGSFLLTLGSPLCAVHTLLMISAHKLFQAHILRTACHVTHLPFRTTVLFFKLLSNETAWSVHLATAQNRTE